MDKFKMSFAVGALRRASYKWPSRYNTLKAARVGRNQYRCAHCDPGVVHKKQDIQLDHVSPVVSLDGWDGWENFIERMYADEGGFQVLCKKHHQEKSNKENAERKLRKKNK